MHSLLPLLSLGIPFFTGILSVFTCSFKFFESFFKKVEKIVLLFGAGFTLLTVLSMVPYILSGAVLEVPLLSLRVDLTNMAGIIGVALIFFLTSIYNIKAEKGGRWTPNQYNFFLLLLLGCLLGLLLSRDIFGIYLFVKLTSCISILLVTHAHGKPSTEAAFKYLIITATSALFILLGTLVIFLLTGASNISSVIANKDALIATPHLLMLAVACFIIGIGADIGLIPFHGWLPDVFSASTPIVLGFFSAKKIALIITLYKLIHPFYIIYPSGTIVMLVVGVGLVSMILGALLAYSQKDFMRMMAYCSIDEFGHIVFVFGLLTSISFVVGQYYLVNSALMKTGMILSLGSVFFNAKTRNMDSLGGLLGKMNKTALSYMICALSLIGVPPMSGFYAKWLLYNVTYHFVLDIGGLFVAVSVLVLLICISMVSFIFLIRSFHRIFMGRIAENMEKVGEVHWAMWLPTAILAAVAILLGLLPNILLGLIGTT